MAVNDPRHSKLQDRLKVGHAVSQSLRMQFIVYLMDNLTQKGHQLFYTAQVATNGGMSIAQPGSKSRGRTAILFTIMRFKRQPHRMRCAIIGIELPLATEKKL